MNKAASDLLGFSNKKYITHRAAEKSAIFARYVEKEMEALCLGSLLGNKYRLVKYPNVWGVFLCTSSENDDYVENIVLSIDELEGEHNDYLMCGNLYSVYQCPTRQDVRRFIGDVEKIMEELSAYKDLDVEES